MRIGTAVGVFATLTAAYVGALLYLDTRQDGFRPIADLGTLLLPVAAASIGSWLIRYARWRWLLGRLNQPPIRGTGLLAYLAGFAFTVSPAKAGELVRVRYHQFHGISAESVVACFVVERASDLVVLLLLATLTLSSIAAIGPAIAFVAFALAVLITASRLANSWRRLASSLQGGGYVRLGSAVAAVGNGLSSARRMVGLHELTVSLLIGVLAWLLQAAAFAYLISALGYVVPLTAALGIYPLGMLLGAASMIPGGIGSTELAITLLLTPFGLSMETAALAAVAMRLCSIWLSIALGLCAIVFLEWKQANGREAVPFKATRR